VKKDIPELRSYLVAHVGYLNMQLSTALLWVHQQSAPGRCDRMTGHWTAI
jgi:hypothetical protein